MLRKTILSAGLIAAAGMLAGARGANAQTVTATWSNVTPAANAGNNNINAVATFNIDALDGTVTITLLNQTIISSPGDLLREVDFSLSPTATINSINDTLTVGNLLDVSGGTVASSTPDVNTALLRNGKGAAKGWVYGSGNFGTPTAEHSLSAPSGEDLVMGPPTEASLGTLPPYYAVNEALTGVSGIGDGNGHSYELDGIATFTLNLSGLTASTLVSDISLGFGTSSGEGFVTPTKVTYLNYTPTPAGGELPIPATLPLVGGGLLGLGLIALRKRRRLSQSR